MKLNDCCSEYLSASHRSSCSTLCARRNSSSRTGCGTKHRKLKKNSPSKSRQEDSLLFLILHQIAVRIRASDLESHGRGVVRQSRKRHDQSLAASKDRRAARHGHRELGRQCRSGRSVFSRPHYDHDSHQRRGTLRSARGGGWNLAHCQSVQRASNS